jgi:hypothetical protein
MEAFQVVLRERNLRIPLRQTRHSTREQLRVVYAFGIIWLLESVLVKPGTLTAS